MIARILVGFSGSIFLLLGAAHLRLTYFGPKLLPRNRDLVERMRADHLVITNQTTLWRAWIGFNASHSLGAMLFGFIYVYLAVAYPVVLFSSIPLQLCGLIFLLAYLVLAIRYWFITPLVGVLLSLLSYAAALVIAWA